MRVAKTIELDAQTQRELGVLSQHKRIEVRLQQRARIVLLAAKGMQNKAIAADVGLDRRPVALCRACFLEGGIKALSKDAPRCGRPASMISMCQPRHRHEEWLKFRRLIDRKTLKALRLHRLVDNYATHSHPEVQAWLAKHPGLFRDITEKRIRRDNFTSVPELELAIDLYVAQHNQAFHLDCQRFGPPENAPTFLSLCTPMRHRSLIREQLVSDVLRHSMTRL